VLYLSSIFHIFEKRLKNQKILVSIILFVDNGLFISQGKSLVVSNSYIFYSVIEHEKTEIFHFFKIHRIFNPPLLDLSTLGGSILHSKETWNYLGFIFNRKLTFQQHIKFYINKAISTVKCINLLRNSLRGLIS